MILYLLVIIFVLFQFFKKNIVALVFLVSSTFYVFLPIFCYELGIDGKTSLGKLLDISNIYEIGFLYTILIPPSCLILSKIKAPPVNYYYRQLNLKLLFVISFFLIIIYYSNLISEYNSLYEFFITNRFERYNNDVGKGRFVGILQALPFLFGFIILNEKNSFLRKTSVVLLILILFFTLFSGERRIAFNFLLFYLIYSYNLKTISISKIKRILLFAFPILVLLGITRNYTSNMLDDQDFEISEKIIESSTQLIINGENTNHFIINDYIIRENKKLLFGISYLNSFPILMPSFILEDRPKTFGAEFPNIYLGVNDANRSSYASSLLGESIANWGLFLAVPFLFIFLILFVSIINIFLKTLPDRSRLFFYSLLISSIIGILFRIDSNNLIRMFFYNVVFLTFFISVLSFNNKLKNG